jgi:two-component system, LytTR family, response regulator
MKPICVAVVDDEPVARRRIVRLLGGYRQIDVVAECAHATALAEVMHTRPIDAIFVDIEMPGTSGLDAVRGMREPRPSIVFVTAYSEYAANAFEVDATDYLVKPVSRERLDVAVCRIQREIAAGRAAEHEASAITDPASAPRHLRRLTVSLGRRLMVIECDSIDHVVAYGNYLKLHVGTSCYALQRSIAWLESRLDPNAFVRTHRSHLVRIDAIAQARPLQSGRYLLQLKTGETVPSGRLYRDRLRAALGIRPA